MLRRLLQVVLIVVLMWIAWWAAASFGLKRSISTWFDARQAEGWQAEYIDLSQHGFPAQLHSQIRKLALADPSTGVAVEMPQLDLSSPIYWPGYLTVTVPPEPILFASQAGRASVLASAAQAALRLHPGTALQMQSVAFHSGQWTVSVPEGDWLSADDLNVAAVQDGAAPARYDFDLSATNLSPGERPRAILNLPAEWPLAFDALVAKMTVTFDTPWDRAALETRRPQPRQITLHQADGAWGDITVQASGTINIDTDGAPEGSVTLKVENWPKLLDMATASSVLPQTLKQQAEALIGAVASVTGQPDALDIMLQFQSGVLRLGPLPLGPVPRIYLR